MSCRYPVISSSDVLSLQASKAIETFHLICAQYMVILDASFWFRVGFGRLSWRIALQCGETDGSRPLKGFMNYATDFAVVLDEFHYDLVIG